MNDAREKSTGGLLSNVHSCVAFWPRVKIAVLEGKVVFIRRLFSADNFVRW